VPRFRACYDYGMGGIWLYVEAASAAEVVERYPALVVVKRRPSWMSPEEDRKLRAKADNPFWTKWLADLANEPPAQLRER